MNQNGVDVEDLLSGEMDGAGGADFDVFGDDKVKSELDEKNEELAEKQKQAYKDFARLFSTERGKRVLDFLLNKTIREPVVDPNHQQSEVYAYYRGGQNELMRRIGEFIERGKKLEQQEDEE